MKALSSTNRHRLAKIEKEQAIPNASVEYLSSERAPGKSGRIGGFPYRLCKVISLETVAELAVYKYSKDERVSKHKLYRLRQRKLVRTVSR